MSYSECECKVVQMSGQLVRRQEKEIDPLALSSASCLTCGSMWLYNYILSKWAKTWDPEGRAWISGYATVEDHEKAKAVHA